MTNNCTVSRGNAYCEARLEAARRNYSLNSREGASEMLYISDRSLADYERGLITPPPDVVMRMAEVYEAPELLNHYCACECPAGRGRIREAPVLAPPHVATRLRAASYRLPETLRALDELTEGGAVDRQSMPELLAAVEELAGLKQAISELELMADKLRRGLEPTDGCPGRTGRSRT